MPDFRTAPLEEILVYMAAQGFGYSIQKPDVNNPNCSVLFEAGGDVPNANRYTNRQHVEQAVIAKTIRKTAAWALYREAEKNDTMTPEIEALKEYWLAG